MICLEQVCVVYVSSSRLGARFGGKRWWSGGKALYGSLSLVPEPHTLPEDD